MKRRIEAYTPPDAGIPYPICGGKVTAYLLDLSPQMMMALFKKIPAALGQAVDKEAIQAAIETAQKEAVEAGTVEGALDGAERALELADPMSLLLYAAAGLALEHPAVEWETPPVDPRHASGNELVRYARAIAEEAGSLTAIRYLRMRDIGGILPAIQKAGMAEVEAAKND